MTRADTRVRRRLHAIFAAVRRLFGIRSAAEQWEKTWTQRQAALEALFGKSGEHVLHAPIPFELGGQADVLIFPNHIMVRLSTSLQI
jgi:hypothetical protein